MTTPTPKECPPMYSISVEREAAGLGVHLSGSFALNNVVNFMADIRRELDWPKISSLTLDFSDVCYLDSAAALSFVHIQQEAAKHSVPCHLIHLNDEVSSIFGVISEDALAKPPFKPIAYHDNLVQKVGKASIIIWRDFVDFISFVGELTEGILYTIRHPRSLRGRDVLFYVQRAGVDGLPIVALIGLLIGLIIAFMSFLQFKQLGANIYVPTLVAFGMVKELGPIMTAILVAGRSGSAFAAEIGTMMVNEEVDALQTMGFDPIRFLAIPKLLAMVIVVPILTIYADVFGILGGMLIGVTSLDLTVKTYITQSINAIKVFDIVTSMIKAAVFASVIAAIGCQRGFQVRSGAQDVGKYTTSAVVTAIFFIVVIDSIFAIMLYYMKQS